MTQGLGHITFIMRDLGRITGIVGQVPDARLTCDSAGRGFSLSPERSIDIGGVWIAIMQHGRLPSRSCDHLAFRIGKDEFDARRSRIRALDLRAPRPRLAGERRSVRFHDEDNQRFERHTGRLAERLRRDANAAGGHA